MLFSASGSSPAQAAPTVAVAKPVACRFFGSDYALKIIGQKIRSIEEEMVENDQGKVWTCAFTAASGMADAPKVFFRIMHSTSEDLAKQDFDAVRQSNKNHVGFEEWHDIADEAVLHSDSPNFHFVMIRKGNRTIRMKINPAHGVSQDVVKAVAMALETRL